MNTDTRDTTTLFGGQILNVLHRDNTQEEVKIVQLPLEAYERAYRLQEDEFALTAFFTRSAERPDEPKTKEWVFSLDPKSYEELRALSEEINSEGFFIIWPGVAGGIRKPRKKCFGRWEVCRRTF